MTSLVSEDDAMNRRRTIALALVLVAGPVWAAACGDGATEPPAPTPDPPRATTLTVTPATLQLVALGATEQLTAEVRDQNGNAMAGAAVSWASGAGGVAAVNASGLVTAAGNGTATITATSGSASGSAAVTVEQAVRAVAVTPAADTLLAAGDTLRLTAAASDANGHAIAGAEFSWASGDTAVATVDAAGLVTGVTAGEVEIAAASSGATGSAALVVADPAPTAMAVTPDTLVLTALGQTAQLAAEVQDQIGRVMEGVLVFWSSADTAVAAVDSAGLVTAIGGGSATIVATAGEISGTAAVTVMQSAGSIVVSPRADTVALGDTLRLAAEALDSNGHAVAGAEFRWSSSDPSVATVDDSGLVRGQAEGKAAITAAAGGVEGASEITVANPDRAALVALYEATDGPNWVNDDNWLTDAPLGEWYGVGTDGAGRVVSLDLSSKWDDEAQEWIRHGLRGAVPAGLGALTKLRTLDLFYNSLSGPIPAELGNLTNLRTLELGYNDLTGPIPPDLGDLGNLRTLVLRWNGLSGPIPPELGDLGNLERLFVDGNALHARVPPELGNLANLRWLDLGNNNLTGPIPPQLGNLGNLEWLFIQANALTGPIPPQLGNLAALSGIDLRNNALTGPIPQSLLQLDALQSFAIEGNESLCVPGTSAFFPWLRAIERRDDESEILCNATDVAALKQLYLAAGGRDWTESTGWPGDGAVEEWHGVSADSLGRVTALDLSRNGLAGRLPRGLDVMTHMIELRVGGNPGLSGRLPLSLARLSLRTLHYSGTGLCAPADAPFRTWLAGIPSHEGTGEECAPLSDRDVLETLYEVTGGPDWTNSDNWLTDAPLGQWHGVRVNGEDRVNQLLLWDNNLTGPIPPELGKLANLTYLVLGYNDLTGPIPTELGHLLQLVELQLGPNKLTGPIPAELGKLTNLRFLGLSFNDGMGPIPAELGNLANLTNLSAQATGLSGSIPSELGGLVNLTELLLGFGNELTGPIPPELGNLASLTWLDLWGNALTGPIPP